MRIMKLALYAICALVTVIGGSGCTAGGGTVVTAGGESAIVTVEYVEPQTFTNFSVQGRNAQSSSMIFTQEIMRTLPPVMRSRFPGNTLMLRFTDIDLAGRRTTARPGSVRILRPNTTVRLSFRYLIRNRSGNPVANGSQTLFDTLQRTLARNPSHSRPLYFEGQMMRNWLRSISVPR
jgi:hypothetical protein